MLCCSSCSFQMGSFTALELAWQLASHSKPPSAHSLEYRQAASGFLWCWGLELRCSCSHIQQALFPTLIYLLCFVFLFQKDSLSNWLAWNLQLPSSLCLLYWGLQVLCPTPAFLCASALGEARPIPTLLLITASLHPSAEWGTWTLDDVGKSAEPPPIQNSGPTLGYSSAVEQLSLLTGIKKQSKPDLLSNVCHSST